jgi:hypothetical protein
VSRLLNNHELVLRHANGQAKITCKTLPSKSTDYVGQKGGDGKYTGGYYLDNGAAKPYSEGESYKIFWNPDDSSDIVYQYFEFTGGTGVLPQSDSILRRPEAAAYRTWKTQVTNNGDAPTLAFTKDKWTSNMSYVEWWDTRDADILWPGVKRIKGAGDQSSYTYLFEFAGWYLDANCKYLALPDVSYSFDIVLYPGYYISKT